VDGVCVLLPWLLEDERVACKFRGGEGNIGRHFVTAGVDVVTMVKRNQQMYSFKQVSHEADASRGNNIIRRWKCFQVG
jgi:hypothetical protein